MPSGEALTVRAHHVQPPAANAIHTKHSRYELLERVGTGHLAEVFKARATGVAGFAKIVAIKRLLPEVARDPACVAVFNDEARIAAALGHANIARVFECGVTEGLPFLAMEYLDGLDLESILAWTRRRGTRIPLAIGLYIVEAVCRGLAFAHARSDAAGREQPVVHQGLSPRSVFVSHEGAVKLLGFGAVAARGRSARTTEMWTQTSAYDSPEQLQGAPADPRSDLFAVGALLHETLVGRRPFPGDTAEAVRAAICAGRWVRPRELQPDFPMELESIVAKALAVAADARWQTAEELEHALVRYAHQARVTSSVKQLAAWMKAMGEPATMTARARASSGPLAVDAAAETDRRPLRPATTPLDTNLDDEPTPTDGLEPSVLDAPPDRIRRFDRVAPALPRNTLQGLGPSAAAGPARDEVTHDEPTTIRLDDDDSGLEQAFDDGLPTPVDGAVERGTRSGSSAPVDATIVVPEEDMVAQFGLISDGAASSWVDRPTVVDVRDGAHSEAEDLQTPVNAVVAEELARQTRPPARAAPTESPSPAAEPPAAPSAEPATSREAPSAEAPAAAPPSPAVGPRAGREPQPSVGRWVALGIVVGLVLVGAVVAMLVWRFKAPVRTRGPAVVRGTSRVEWRPEVQALPANPAAIPAPDGGSPSGRADAAPQPRRRARAEPRAGAARPN